jgi:hypothetical protein
MIAKSLELLVGVRGFEPPAPASRKRGLFYKNGGFLRFFGVGLTPKSRFFASIGYQSDTKIQRGEGEMREPLDTDRLVWGGSLYPPPDVPSRYSRGLSVLLIALAAVAAGVIVVLMVWPAVLL